MAKKEIVDTQVLAQLASSFPVETGRISIRLPRLGMFSQDVTEGKGKNMKVVAEAGTFYIENESEDTDETGKKLWTKDELGKEIEVIIVYQRKQLKMYDSDTKKFTSSPVYDDDNEVIPLFCDKKEVARGTPEDLKARYMVEKAGKKKSELKDQRVLYVLYNGDLHQLNLGGSSMYSYLNYARKVSPITVVSALNSVFEENGDIEWNKMTFTNVGQISGEQVALVQENLAKVKTAIAAEKQSFAQVTINQDNADEMLDSAVKALTS
jgi:hypothetical protein